MKIIQYNSQTQLVEAYDNKPKHSSRIYDYPISVSFRIYDGHGNTLELHIFYK